MTSIREIFTTFGPEYLDRYATQMPTTHRKVIDAIMACRTEACGVAFHRCDGCAEPQQFFVSCGNRHCPTCQYNKTQQWLQTQIQRQLPGHHFLITFTVPEQLRSFMRQHQRAGSLSDFDTHSLRRKPTVRTITLILIARVSTTGFLNIGLKRLRSRLNPYGLASADFDTRR